MALTDCLGWIDHSMEKDIIPYRISDLSLLEI